MVVPTRAGRSGSVCSPSSIISALTRRSGREVAEETGGFGVTRSSDTAHLQFTQAVPSCRGVCRGSNLSGKGLHCNRRLLGDLERWDLFLFSGKSNNLHIRSGNCTFLYLPPVIFLFRLQFLSSFASKWLTLAPPLLTSKGSRGFDASAPKQNGICVVVLAVVF